eukprot:440432_1
MLTNLRIMSFNLENVNATPAGNPIENDTNNVPTLEAFTESQLNIELPPLPKELIENVSNPNNNNNNSLSSQNVNDCTSKPSELDVNDELFVDINGVKWDTKVNWICGVCEGADGQTDNVLIVCEGCSRAVHQYCYGVSNEEITSDNNWYCQSCKYKKYLLNDCLISKLRNTYNNNNEFKDNNHTVNSLLGDNANNNNNNG